MQNLDKLMKPLVEVKYLTADNVDRYRSIMRIFFKNYERLKYWMYQEEVYDEMIKNPYFKEYRIEQCQQDLAALREWRNLEAIQDTKRAMSVEEFTNKKFRYRMSEYSVEIERLVLRLENLSVEGSSLEPTLLERIRIQMEQFSMISVKDAEQINAWWKDLNNDFIRLNQNYQDYIRDLNSVKAEEMMHTKEFLIFKDRLIEYLRSFIKSLQKNVGIIEELLIQLDENVLVAVLEKVIDYELSIPRIDVEITREQIKEKVYGSYNSIRNWFVSEKMTESEAAKLFDVTNDIIRRITRYAARLSEKNALGANRKEEYRKIASIFMDCENVEEAHKMAAMVFGLKSPHHLKGQLVRESGSMNQGVYEEKALQFKLTPRIRTYNEKTHRSGITESKRKKEEVRRQLIQTIKENQEKIANLEVDGVIDFSNLPVIESRVREILLKWLSNALEDSSYTAKTEDGRDYKLDMEEADKRCIVHCEDGNFTMPKIRLIFTKENL
ncbi:hypothetical protein P261_00937 [Lachnospiraceae bacterium TWA4]|nr:hypothetical protein P261_00937 [Lachnospiraceae bacterium TWA4]